MASSGSATISPATENQQFGDTNTGTNITQIACLSSWGRAPSPLFEILSGISGKMPSRRELLYRGHHGPARREDDRAHGTINRRSRNLEFCTVKTDLLAIDALRELGWSPRDPIRLDIAEANLLCAVGLPGSEGLDVNALLCRIDEIAADVGRAIFLKSNYDRFLAEPEKYYNSQAYFCVTCMISILKTKYGVHYNPKHLHYTPTSPPQNDCFGHDTRDQFIHATLNGEGGTCASIPVFFIAVGRRIGLPLYLVKTMKHLFMRWDDPDGAWVPFDGTQRSYRGAVFNIEATGQAIHVLSDLHYRTVWPHKLTDEEIETHNLLQSLSQEEELAEFLGMRMRCCYYNGRLEQALAAAKWGRQLAPTAIGEDWVDWLTHKVEKSRYMAELNRSEPLLPRDARALQELAEASMRPIARAPTPEPANAAVPTGPRWVHVNGIQALIQILKPLHFNPHRQAAANDSNVGMSLQSHFLQLPNGHTAWAEVPTHSAHRAMAAYWIELSNNEVALVHKQLSGAHMPDFNNLGKPILPERQQPNTFVAPMHGTHNAALRQQAEQRLSSSDENALRQVIEEMKRESGEPRRRFPGSSHTTNRGVAGINVVPTHAHLPPIPRQHSAIVPYSG